MYVGVGNQIFFITSTLDAVILFALGLSSGTFSFTSSETFFDSFTYLKTVIPNAIMKIANTEARTKVAIMYPRF